jgi:hypothetical protein
MDLSYADGVTRFTARPSTSAVLLRVPWATPSTSSTPSTVSYRVTQFFMFFFFFSLLNS